MRYLVFVIVTNGYKMLMHQLYNLSIIKCYVYVTLSLNEKIIFLTPLMFFFVLLKIIMLFTLKAMLGTRCSDTGYVELSFWRHISEESIKTSDSPSSPQWGELIYKPRPISNTIIWLLVQFTSAAV